MMSHEVAFWNGIAGVALCYALLLAPFAIGMAIGRRRRRRAGRRCRR